MRNQNQINFQKLCSAIDFICFMCDEFNSCKCKTCQLNYLIEKYKSQFSDKEKEYFNMPWNGIIGNIDGRTFEWGEDI